MQRFLLFLTLLSINAFGQSNDDKVKEPINRFFEGMRRSDSSLIRASLAPGALLQTIVKSKDGSTSVRTEDLDKFITSVTKPHDAIYDERITFNSIKVDADLAAVWTPYRFYVGEKFSHCGVNSFQLVLINGAWKIQYIIDTRRKESCLEN